MATISKFAVKLSKNCHILAKVGQNVPYSTSLGLKTNFNQLSTSKNIGIEYQIIFLAFSEVLINYFPVAGHFQARPGFKWADGRIFLPESNLFLDIMNIEVKTHHICFA